MGYPAPQRSPIDFSPEDDCNKNASSSIQFCQCSGGAITHHSKAGLVTHCI